VKLLLANGANIEARVKSNGTTALMLAAESGEAQTVKLLLHKGASMEARDNDGKTALDFAPEVAY